MKKLGVILSLIFLFTASGYSYAANGGLLQRNVVDTASPAGARSNLLLKNEAQRMDDLKKRADLEIQRRIDALNMLSSRLSEMKRLSSAQASSLQAQVQSTIDSLNALKTKIDADTDLTTLQADVKSIVKDYYVFAFYIQYINLNATLDRALSTTDIMTTLSNKLATRIQEAQKNGHNTTQMSAWLSGMQSKLNDAKALLQAAQTEIASLTAQGFPGNKTTLQDARTKLKSAYEDMKTSFMDAKEIIGALRILATVPSASSSASLTPTPTP